MKRDGMQFMLCNEKKSIYERLRARYTLKKLTQ
jgi:hypothetical protein